MPCAYQHGRTCVHLLNDHFVFCPKRRKKVLVDEVRTRLIELLHQKVREMGWEVMALEVMPDHVHLFLGANPDVSPTQVMHRLKGFTSRVLRQEFPHLLRLPSLWTRSSFVSTAGNVRAATMERYIAQQDTRGCVPIARRTASDCDPPRCKRNTCCAWRAPGDTSTTGRSNVARGTTSSTG